MSIASEISRISGNITDAFDAIEDKGVTVPTGSTSDDLANLISQISGGGGGNVIVSETTDSHGGTVIEITATTVQMQSKSVTPTESAQTITPDSALGYNGLSEVNVAAISGTYVGSQIERRSSSDLTVSEATVSVPAGYYESAASKAVATGSAGTPSASKGAVSNHSVIVTPSVTNTTGYITGGTKSGTAVTVTASELVSGSETLTSNQANVDVTNLASITVAVPVVTYYVGSSTPSSSQGNNGDIYLQTGA